VAACGGVNRILLGACGSSGVCTGNVTQDSFSVAYDHLARRPQWMPRDESGGDGKLSCVTLPVQTPDEPHAPSRMRFTPPHAATAVTPHSMKPSNE